MPCHKGCNASISLEMHHKQRHGLQKLAALTESGSSFYGLELDLALRSSSEKATINTLATRRNSHDLEFNLKAAGNVYLGLLIMKKAGLSLADGNVVVDALIVVVDGHGESLLGDVLTHDVLVEILVDFFRRRRRFSVRTSDPDFPGSELGLGATGVRLLRVVFGQDDEEVRAFVALNEPRGRHELVDVLARRAALGADLKEEWKWVMEVI